MREALCVLLSSIIAYLAHHFLSIRESMASFYLAKMNNACEKSNICHR
jgi:hypothetical protein